MQHLSFLYSDKQAYREAKKEANAKEYSGICLQLFVGMTKKKELQKILNKLAKDFPQAYIIGATSAGEIAHAKMYENKCVISLSLFEKTRLKVSFVKTITKKSGRQIAKQICTKQTKAAIVLSEGLHGEDYEGFIGGISKENQKLLIAGGLAGDNFKLEKTYLFYGKEIFSQGAVALSFSGKHLFADNEYNLNWTPIGKEFTVTEVQGNHLVSLDNISAKRVFQKYLGKNIFENNAAALPDFQLLYTEGGTTVARTPLAIEGESIVLAGAIQRGQKVQFGFSNVAAVVSGANSITHKMNKKPAEGIYIYSCIARKTLLGVKLEKEFAVFESIAPTAGFFTYGEFYSTSKNNALLNCTTTILTLSESKKKKKRAKEQVTNQSELENITFDALSHFVQATAHELGENVKLLNQYKDIVDHSSLISKTDINGIITYVNDTFCKVSGYTKEELLGKSHNMIRDPNMSSFIFKKMWQTLLSKKVWKGSLSNVAKDGSVYYVNATIMPILNEKGEIQEFIAARQDITKQIESKRKMKEKEKLIKAIFDNQDSIVIYASKINGMQYVNRKLFEYFDYSSFEDFKVKNNCICDLFIEAPGYVSVASDPQWIDTIAGDKEGDYKVKMRIKSGAIHIFNLNVNRVHNDYIINLSDITTLEQALQKAYHSEQTKTRFLANMSHEIRTPLNGILGFTDILQKKELDNDAKRYVEIIHKSGETLLNVVNDILDFSKLESGELSLYKTESDLFKDMEATVATFASTAKKKQINYYVYIDPVIPKSLECDSQRIKQVMNNLISNAIKFTPQDGSIKVTVELASIRNNKAAIRFSVKDSGIGIPKNKVKKIFQAFSQADDSTSREYGGTGLGLSISSQYITMMGSQLKVQTKENEGSEFYFSLELPVVNISHSIAQQNEENIPVIAVLDQTDGISCGVNDIIYTYLQSWNFHYKKITSLEEVDANVDLLVVCSKLFDKESCSRVLDTFEKLHLIYVEGYEEDFSCQHEKFHLLEQPMTGSAFFDKIVSFTPQYYKVQEQQTQTQSKSFQGNILIAEDNLTNQMLISIMLEERGIEYTIANNGQEAIDEIQANDSYDLVFMDINMPVLDGIAATKQLREFGYTKPIVSLSANVIESDILSFKEAGVDDSLHKPIVPAELDAILARYLTCKVDDMQEKGTLQEEVAVEYDIVDKEEIAKKLSMPNSDIIVTLLKSFMTTLQKMLEKLQNDVVDTDMLHNLKGTAGNLRFEKLAELAKEYESVCESWTEVQRQEKTAFLRGYLQDTLKNIEKAIV
ncbi:FIST N-terminal domain-containing protein [Sulfurimonas sp.]